MSREIERRTFAAQLADRIEREIFSGTWSAQLPGKRTLAERYGVNVKTGAAAIDLLERRGLIGPGNAGKGREILRAGAADATAPRSSTRRLLIISRFSHSLCFDDHQLLQRMGESWARAHGGVAWGGVDFARCKSPGPQLDALIRRHSPDALLLHNPGPGWSREADARLPFYQMGGTFDSSLRMSMGCSLVSTEVRRIVKHLCDLGHRRILLPTEGMSDWMWRAHVNALRQDRGPKPETGSWEDYCPQFPDQVPEAWDGYWRKAFVALRPTAVIVSEDTHLLSLYGFCATQGLRIPADVSVVSQNYVPQFEWMRPRPVMMRYPSRFALTHFNQWLEGGLKPLGRKIFTSRMCEGGSVAPAAG